MIGIRVKNSQLSGEGRIKKGSIIIGVNIKIKWIYNTTL